MKQIREYLPVITVLLIFLGYTGLSSFYNKFGIDIYNYISTSEILTLFLPEIAAGAKTIILLFGVLTTFIFNRFDEKIFAELRTEEKLHNSLISFKYTALAAFFLTAVIKYFSDDIEYEIIGTSIFFVLAYVYYKLKYQFKELAFDSTFLVAWLLVIVTMYEKNRADNILENGNSQVITFLHHNKLITTNDSTLNYLGQTQDYMLLYNTTEKKAFVLKKENIDSITLDVLPHPTN